MRCARTLSALSISLLAVLSLSACGPQEAKDDQAAVQAEAWASLQQAKADLDAQRQELAELRDRLAAAAEAPEGEAAPAGEGEEGEAGDAAPPTEEQLAELREKVDKMAADFTGQVAEFINSQEIYEGEPLTEIQRAAFDMKAGEDILVAQEYIDKAGNYQKAIDIYNTALLADPESEILLAAKAEAEELRYMTEERFAEVKKGMPREEVKKLLGTPMPVNVREFEEGKVIGWFYPKEEPRTAAGVYFRQKKGEFVVYSSDFEAIKADEEEG